MDIQSLTKEDIRRKLDPNGLKTTAIIQGALIGGPLLFFFVVLFLHFSVTVDQPPGPGGGPEQGMLFLQTMGGLSLMSYLAAYIIPNFMLKPASLQSGLVADNPVDWMLNRHRTIAIIRLAMTEGAALFGLVVMILAVMGKYLSDFPILWLGAVPLLIHVAFGLLTFPTKNTVADFLDQRMLKPLQRHHSSV